MADPLAADTLLERMRSLAAPDTRIASAVQALALLAHAIHAQLDFRLVHPQELPSDWLERDQFKLRYRHDQSSLEFVVSVQDLAPSPRLLIAAAADADDTDSRSSTLDLATRDYFSPSAFPCALRDLTDQNPFAATHRFKDLVLLYRINIIQKLLPGLYKPGYEQVSAAAAAQSSGRASSSSSSPIAGTGPYLPDRGGPMGMFPPGGGGGGQGGGGGAGRPPPSGPSPAPPFPGGTPDDPLRIPGSGGRGGIGGGAFPLADIGRRDLDPLGGMGGTFGGPSGFGRLPGFGTGGGLGGGGGDNGGGMFMGPDHPLFRERFGPDSDLAGGRGGARWGGDGYLPPMGAPPGARFDPVGPMVRTRRLLS